MVQVSNEIETNDGYIYHPTCKQRCPETCDIGWKTFDDPKEPWKIDHQIDLSLGELVCNTVTEFEVLTYFLITVLYDVIAI